MANIMIIGANRGVGCDCVEGLTRCQDKVIEMVSVNKSSRKKLLLSVTVLSTLGVLISSLAAYLAW